MAEIEWDAERKNLIKVEENYIEIDLMQLLLDVKNAIKRHSKTQTHLVCMFVE